MPSKPAAHTPVTHYENFPVATWLCPPELRAPIAAIYHYARTADDIADEGQLPAAERLQLLRQYRHCLREQTAPPPEQAHWRPVLNAVHDSIARHDLPMAHFEALLDAFEQDIRKSAAGQGYADREELLDYCARSANPVGRLVLHLHGVDDEASMLRSDAICTGLQLINFWQDLRRDIPRGRWYVPERDASAFGASRPMQQQAVELGVQPVALTNLMRELVGWSRGCLLQGAPLVRRLQGRTSWELRAVVQGGLRIAEKMEKSGYACYERRPRITRADAPVLLWRAWRME